LDRNAILSGLISSYQSYSGTDSRSTVEKVLKYSGDSADLIQRADVKREVAVFRLNGGTRGSSITNDVYTITLTTVGSTEEQDGYLSTILNFQSILKLQ